MKTLLLLDASRYLPNALRYGPPLEMVGVPGVSPFAAAIHYVGNNMESLPKSYGADFVAYLFDASLPIFPTELEHENTAKSTEIRRQVELIHQLLKLLGWSLFFVPDGQGPNAIATLAANAATQGMRVIILTNNICLYQSANDNIAVLGCRDRAPLDGKGVVTAFGIDPSQLADYFTLVGVVVNKFPKVAGVGQRTAVKLLQRYGTLDNIIDNLRDIEGVASSALALEGDSLLAERDSLRINNSLDAKAILSPYTSVESLKPPLRNYDQLRMFYAKHGFSRKADIEALGDIGNVSGSTLFRLLAKDRIPAAKDLVDRFIVPEKFRGKPVVYAITNRRTGQRYFGSAVSAERRAIEHMKLLVGNAHSNWMLNDDYQQLGREAFDFRVLASFSSIADAKEREQLYLKMFWGRSNCYNISPFAIEVDAEELKLQLLTASNKKIFFRNKRPEQRDTAKCSGYGRYLTVHAAARDLDLSKKGISDAIYAGDGVFSGWSFEVTPLKWRDRRVIKIG